MLIVVQFAYYYPKLPETIASHFDGAGNPNGCMSKSGFFKTYALIVILIMTACLLLPKLISRIPAQLINLPNKDYWLAPERREEAFQKIQDFTTEFSDALLVFLITVMQLVFKANLSKKIILSSAMPYLLIAFFAYTLLWLLRFFRTFKSARP